VTQTIPQGTEVTVESPVLKRGKIEIGSRAAWNATPPYWMVIILRTYFYSASGISALVGASDFLTGKQAKIIMFFMGVVGLVIGGFAKATGVVSETEK
jgi:hypothetical protein